MISLDFCITVPSTDLYVIIILFMMRAKRLPAPVRTHWIGLEMLLEIYSPVSKFAKRAKLITASDDRMEEERKFQIVGCKCTGPWREGRRCTLAAYHILTSENKAGQTDGQIPDCYFKLTTVNVASV